MRSTLDFPLRKPKLLNSRIRGRGRGFLHEKVPPRRESRGRRTLARTVTAPHVTLAPLETPRQSVWILPLVCSTQRGSEAPTGDGGDDGSLHRTVLEPNAPVLGRGASERGDDRMERREAGRAVSDPPTPRLEDRMAGCSRAGGVRRTGWRDALGQWH